MEIGNLLNIAVVGTLLSLIIDFLKAKLGTESWATKFMTVFLAIVVGTVYVLFANTNIFVTIVAILGASSTVYALILK